MRTGSHRKERARQEVREIAEPLGNTLPGRGEIGQGAAYRTKPAGGPMCWSEILAAIPDIQATLEEIAGKHRRDEEG
jgi:hypothetical protein